MINSNGIIQNNKTASEFIRKQRKLNSKYAVLSKEEERKMIGEYARLKLTDGKATWNDKFECDFEWIGDEAELRKKLVMHNLQAVTKITAKHCQDTRDYDNMFAKGLYGLTKAANIFHPFKCIVKNKVVQFGSDGIPLFCKFNTFAQFWIFKYVIEEFYDKSIKMDNNSVSLDELVKIHNSTSKNITFENYLSGVVSPDIERPKTVEDEVVASELSTIYDSIHQYIATTDQLSSVEKSILDETFYNGNKSIKKLSSLLNITQRDVVENQTSALNKLKDYLYEEFGIESLSDII